MMYHSFMRTTVNLDEDVLQAARELAAQRGSTIGQVLSELARRGLRPEREPEASRGGVPLLPPREGAGPVTLESVRRLLDEE
jgi:hypothetical protein